MKTLKIYLLWTAVICAMTVTIISETVNAEVARAKAWLWANQTTTAAYLPPAQYQYNSAGATNRVTRTGVGRYRVDFPRLGTDGGMVQVTSYGGNHHCKVSSWGPNGRSQRVNIGCFSPNGSASDGKFTVLFYKEKRGIVWDDGYVWADRPSAPFYTPSSAYQWNSKNRTNKVRRTRQGNYEVQFPGLNQLGGTVLVTAYGTTPDRCKVKNWSQTGNDTIVRVGCFDTTGRPVDTKYTLSYMSDVALGVKFSEEQHDGGFLWANNPDTPSYAPSKTYQLNSAGPDHKVTRLAEGTYIAHLPNLKPLNKSTSLVTAYGGGREYCTINRWNSDGNGGTKARVQCFNTFGNRADSKFTLLYLTNNQVLF